MMDDSPNFSLITMGRLSYWYDCKLYGKVFLELLALSYLKDNTHDSVKVSYVSNRSPVRTPPITSCRYVEENGTAAMLATKRSAGVTPEENLGECVTWMSLLSANGFKTKRRHHQKSKTRVSAAPQKRRMPANCFKKVFRKKLTLPAVLKQCTGMHSPFQSIYPTILNISVRRPTKCLK